MTRRIGIYPGTFDPVHQGHLAFCLKALEQGELDEIVLIPECLPRNKPGATELSERLALLEEATAFSPFLSVTTLTSDRFTVEQTLPELYRRFEGAKLSLLIGSDVVSSLGTWEGIRTLTSNMSLVIGMREADTVSTVELTLRQIGQSQNISVRYSLIETVHADVASSRIRKGEMALDLSLSRMEWQS